MDSPHKTPYPLRALLPAPPNSSLMTVTVQSKQQKLSAACQECRVRKTKCNGARPKCQACISRALVCQYGLTESRRVKQRAQASDELLEMLRNSSEADAISLLRRIRASSDAEAVAKQVRDGNLLMQLSVVPETRRRYELPYISEIPASLLTPENPYVRSVIFETNFDLQLSTQGPVYTIPYHAADVHDALIDKVTTWKWTSIISDDELLRRLLKTFFQYAYAEWYPFHKDLFLSDMAAGRTRFCSSLLVNAVLANASYSYSKLPDRAKYWLPDNLTYKFTAEAKRLWDLENVSGKSRLTTIQASQILSVIMDFDGVNTLGRLYTIQGIGMAHSLNLFKTSRDIKSQRMRQARIWTAWSLYSWQAMISYYFHQPPYITEPPEDPLPDDPTWYGELYLRYPSSESLFPMRLCHCIKAKCQLRAMKNAIALQTFGGVDAETKVWLPLEQAELFKSRLDAWFEALPEPLTPSRVVFPKDIGIHLEYLNIITDLLVPHISNDMRHNARVETSSNESPIQSPELAVYYANQRKETLMRLYYLRHSFDSFDPMFVNFIVERYGACISGLNADTPTAISQRLPTREVLRSTLILCAAGLRTHAKNYHVCTLAYHVLQSKMRSEDLQLLLTYITPPTETDMPLIKHGAVTSWPLPIIKMTEDPEKSALNRMVSEYQKLRDGVQCQGLGNGASPTDVPSD